MLKSIFLAILAAAALAMPGSANAVGGSPETAHISLAAGIKAVAKTGCALVSGLNLYYEIRGSGGLFLFLSDGLDVTALFGDVLAQLAENRIEFAAGPREQGRTASAGRAIVAQFTKPLSQAALI